MTRNEIVMRFFSFSVGLAVLLLTGVFYSVLLTTNMTSSLPAVMKLDVEGSISVSYSESDIKNVLPIVSGWGGKQKTQEPFKIDIPTYWKGIHLPSMLNSLVAELDYNISVRSSDGYNANLTRQQVNGAIRTFNDENVTLVTKAIPVLAFEENNITLDAEDGPLRLVFVGENNESILTISTLWIKQVDTIHITVEDGITVTLSTTTQSSVGSSSSSTTAKTSPGSTIWVFVPTLILLILYHRKKRD